MSSATNSIEELESLLVVLQNTLGIVLPDEQRGELIEKIEPLLAAYQLDSPASLTTIVADNKIDTIRSDIFDVLSRDSTDWGLNDECRDLLCDYIFPQLQDGARIWIAGCGSGSLAYYVAMELTVYEHNSGVAKNFEIIASDVSKKNIKQAESAIYSKQQLKGLREDYKKLFVVPDARDGSGKVKDKIRQRLSFIQCDLTSDFQSIGPVELIICPDALVYFSSDSKADILLRLAELLKSGGILLPGKNQFILTSGNLFERVEHNAGIFYRNVS